MELLIEVDCVEAKCVLSFILKLFDTTAKYAHISTTYRTRPSLGTATARILSVSRCSEKTLMGMVSPWAVCEPRLRVLVLFEPFRTVR
jgi:hypothetical protein